MGRVCTIQKCPAAEPILQRPHTIHTGQIGGLAFPKFDSGIMLQHEQKQTQGKSVCVRAKTGANWEDLGTNGSKTNFNRQQIGGKGLQLAMAAILMETDNQKKKKEYKIKTKKRKKGVHLPSPSKHHSTSCGVP
jgi:hypothetical protein